MRLNGRDMVGIPRKALKISKLNLDKRVGEGSHKVWQATYIDETDGKIKSGFFKELDPEKNFPELLAKISVAMSVILKSFQERTAQEHLVFDEEGHIVGILSISLKDFKPLNIKGDLQPGDIIEKEQVVPSFKTLIYANMMEILFGRWYLGDDDPHPRNLSLKGGIDYDMFAYWFVVFMKGARSGIELPKERVDLTVHDYERFPCLIDAKPYHWPTFAHPGRGSITFPVPEVVQTLALPKTLPKVYEAPEQFARLAASPEAQAQKVAAALKALLTYQPEIMRQRLFDEFECFSEDEKSIKKTSMPFDYTSLGQPLREKYEQTFPQLCNENTNKKAFIDFIMMLYQKHYDNLYRVVVFYMGCENNGFGVPLLATNEELYRRPSIYKEIQAWVIKQNEEEYANTTKCQYQLGELQKRYHQVWRDAYTLRLKELIQDARNLTSEIAQLVTDNGNIEPLKAKEVSDESVTDVCQLLGTLKNISFDKRRCVNNDSPLNKALDLLTQFTNQFQSIVKAYYEKKGNELTESDNVNFTKGLQKLCLEYDEDILKTLAHTTSHSINFACIIRRLQEFAEQAKFTKHLLSSDEQMEKVTALSKKALPPLTHPDVLAEFNETLFRWVDSISVQEFNQYIHEIVDKKYPQKSLICGRVQSVKDYLKKSVESNHNKLAYILGSAVNDEGALNTCIIRELTPIMLQTNHIPSVTSATRDGGAFEEHITLFTKEAVNYAKSNSNLVHLYSPQGISLLFNTLYHWVEKIPSNRLILIKNASLTQYEEGLSYWNLWGAPSRKSEINQYFRTLRADKALASVFFNGQPASTASASLLINVIKEIQRDISENPKLKEQPGYALISVFNESEHKNFYLSHIKGKYTEARVSHVENHASTTTVSL